MYLPRSFLSALAVLFALGLWLASGFFTAAPPPEGQGEGAARVAAGDPNCLGAAPPSQGGVAPPPCVRVRVFATQIRSRILTLPAVTDGSETVTARSEIAGTLVAQGVAKGGRVAKGDLICRIAIENRRQQLSESKALEEETAIDFKAAGALERSGLASQLRLAETRTAFEKAKASVALIESQIEKTEILAPIDGLVSDYQRIPGEVILPGEACAVIVADDPVHIVAHMPQNAAGAVKVGDRAKATVVGGVGVDAEIVYVAPRADRRTRRFRIELKADNADGRLPLGVSGEVYLTIGSDRAAMIPHAALVLDDAGRLGVWTVAAGAVADFAPIVPLDDSQEGIWVAGIPEGRPVIVLGQGYVKQGDAVFAVDESRTPIGRGP